MDIEIKREEKIARMKELIARLDEAAKAYYQDDLELMSNNEYDGLYDELQKLENELGIQLSSSPSIKVGYEPAQSLKKEAHEKIMLSLDKTKSVEALADWLGDARALLSWKLDGLTVVLSYNEGRLVKALTRGNGIEGEVVTENAKAFINLPVSIDYKGELLLRGEAVISYENFRKINATSDLAAKYKNPRNLCSGSVRQLNPNITRQRQVEFVAFSLVRASEVDFENSRFKQLSFLKSLGFDVVETVAVDAGNVAEAVANFEKKINDYSLPSDGLVLSYDDIDYGESLGSTAKFPRNSIAFKWEDEIAISKLKYIEWSASRTGLINPIAVFEAVELEGTTVSRASLHNVSQLENLELGIGDEIKVYKANMIIPQIAENMTKSNNIDIPDNCPVCSSKLLLKNEAGVKTLHCVNEHCPVKELKHYSLLSGRDALNIEGLSEMSLEKFITMGFIKEMADIYRLSRYREKIVSMEGFGEKSYENLNSAINRSRKTTLARFIYSLGIAGIGVANAKMLAKYYDDDLEKFLLAAREDLLTIEGIGEVLATAIVSYLSDGTKLSELRNLAAELDFEKKDYELLGSPIAAKTFVITGKLVEFANRKVLGEFIEERGGRLATSVSSNTDFLINNDLSSNSSKNKKARELGISIINEEDFIKMFGGEHAD